MDTSDLLGLFIPHTNQIRFMKIKNPNIVLTVCWGEGGGGGMEVVRLTIFTHSGTLTGPKATPIASSRI